MEASGGDVHMRELGEKGICNLYPEILGLIFSYLDVQSKGRVARVCQYWNDVCYQKSVWKGVEAKLHLRRCPPQLFESLVRRGIQTVQVLSIRRHTDLRDLVCGVTNLRSLNLTGCYNISDESLKLAFRHLQCPSLIILNLSLCKKITDDALRSIAPAAVNLQELKLGGCSFITNTGMMIVAWEMLNLKYLDLRSCSQVSNQGIANIALSDISNQDSKLSAAHALQGLGLQDCQKISDESLGMIAEKMGNLTSINLSFCSLISDYGMKHVARMTSLRELNLRSCDISDAGISSLTEGGSGLTHLDISFCDKITDQALAHISQGMFTLKSLSMCACRVTDDGIQKIARTLHELHTLNVGQCSKLTDRGMQIISEHMTNLSHIDLYGCIEVSTIGMQKINSLPRLKVANYRLWHRFYWR